MAEVTALGELLIDFTTESRDSSGYPCMTAHPGGAPANFLAALSACGVSTAFLGKVGKDAFGDLLIRTLRERGILTEGVLQDTEAFTTLAFVTVDERGERHFSFARKPGADTCLRFDEIDLRLIDEARVFHFGTLSLTDDPARTATVKAAAYAKKQGRLLSFDPNYRPPLWKSPDDARQAMLWGLENADIVKISDEEVRFLWGIGPEDGAEKILSEFKTLLVTVTCGKDGAVLLSRNAACRVTCPSVTPRDTTGAGDIFGGFALAELLKTEKSTDRLNEDELIKIGTFAAAAASLSTERYGGISSVPTPGEVNKLLKRQKL